MLLYVPMISIVNVTLCTSDLFVTKLGLLLYLLYYYQTTNLSCVVTNIIIIIKEKNALFV